MANLARHHPVTWQAPRPLWRGATPYAASPQILRFASDDFMEQMLATLAADPAALGQRIARPETWRTPVAEAAVADMVARVPLPAHLAATKRRRLFKTSRPAAPPTPPADAPLKLFQPAHQRHYLIAGTLACALPGLPERQLRGDQETVHLVVRRLLPESAALEGPQTLREFAYVQDGEEARWRRVAEGDGGAAVLAPGEELLPLFRLAHEDEEGRPRALWAGVVPVGRREGYLGVSVDRTVATLSAGQARALRPGAAPAPRPSTVGRLTQFRMTVAEPWKAMVRSAIKASAEMREAAAGNPVLDRGRRLDQNLQFQMQSWLILADFYDFLQEHLTPVADAVRARSGAGLSGAAATLHTRLGGLKADALIVAMRDPALAGSAAGNLKPMAASLAEALALVADPAVRAALEAQKTHYARAGALAREAGWPPFHFLLAGVDENGIAAGPFAALGSLPAAAAGEADSQGSVTTPLAVASASDPAEDLDRLTALVGRALVPDAEPAAQPLPFAMKLRDTIVATAGDAGLFVIRFVHLNRDCGPLHQPTLSAPSERFHMASLFDPDAPVRPIRITLPADTSPAGLRKHGRGTAFVLSDMLCGQVQRAKGLGFVDLVRQVLPWPLHKDIDIGSGGACKGGSGVEIGMICSLSLPIITLCALILLIIIVTLLDFIFRWVPWFIACFPVPGLKGKG